MSVSIGSQTRKASWTSTAFWYCPHLLFHLNVVSAISFGFHSMHLQNEELQAVKTTVLEQQGKVLVPFQLDAIKYVDWEPDQREAYLQRLHHALWTLRR